MSELQNGYQSDQRTFSKEHWKEILGLFDDANIYQTWSYDAIRYGPGSIRHQILSKNGEIVAAAQIRIMMIPFLNTGIAYVRWGPLWKKRGSNRSPEIFRQVLRALKYEYVFRQGLMLRVFPALFQDEDQDLISIFSDEGYLENTPKNWGRTILIDIRPPLDIIRKSFDQKWRNCLNRAERNSLEVIEGESETLYMIFKDLYQQMLRRKKFSQPNDLNEFQSIQKDLPKELKMRIFISRSNDGIGAGAICSAMGNKGVYLFGATNERGMVDKGAYIIQWKAIQWLKNAGCDWYDLNGINPNRNPGTYRFKAGIAGKSGRDIIFLGQYDFYSSRIGQFLLSNGDRLFSIIRPIRKFIIRH